MKFLLNLVAASLLMAGPLATAQSSVEGRMDDEVAKGLVDRRLAAQQPVVEDQMAAWKADVLKKVLATWERPSQTASSATWLMRVKTDPQGRLLNLSWITPTGIRSLDRSIVNAFKDAEPYPAPPDAEAANSGIEFADEATSKRHAEEQLARSTARNAAAIAEIQSAGPLRAYLALVSYRYKKCESIANEWLDADNQKLGITSVAFPMIENCVRDEESALSDEVHLALQVAPEKVSEPIKSLHAYTVASLRALTNFYQSVIEARQARAERSTGIDERATRIALEL